MPKLYNLARMTTATTGTGTITLGSASSGFLTFAAAGVANGDIVFYGIKDGANSEVGYGTYTASGPTLSRNVVKSTNSNAAIALSGAAEVYITAVASDGGDLLPGFDHPLRGFDAPINLQLNASVASNILTIAVKGNNGSDPGNSNPVLIPFRDATVANGGPVWRAVTAALSINTNATGATLGTANTVPFRLWVVAFDNAGTVVLALWQSVTGGGSPTAIAPLNEAVVASSTAISSAATSAGTFYTPNGTTVTSRAFRILGYVDYASGLTTAGTYVSAPTTIQLFGPGIRRPGDTVQVVQTSITTSVTNSTTGSYTSSGLSASITPTSTPNLVEFVHSGTANMGSVGRSGEFTTLRGATRVGPVVRMTNDTATNAAPRIPLTIGPWLDAPGAASSVTYTQVFAANGVTFPAGETAFLTIETAPMILKERMV